MSDAPILPDEAPALEIETSDEFRNALFRIRELEIATDHSADALLRATLQQAIARYMDRHGVAPATPEGDIRGGG